MAREASLQQTLNDAVEHHLENMHFCIPAIVIRSNLENQLVDVQPSLNMKMYDGSGTIERPAIISVPLVFPVSKTAGFTFPVSAGDTVLLVFSERGLDAWKAGNGYPSTPTDFRMMDYKDAIAIPGLMPSGNSSNNPSKHVLAHNTLDTVLFSNLGGAEAEVRLKVDGSIEVNTSNMPVTINCSVANINATEEVNLTTPVFNVDAQNTLWTGAITHIGNYVQTGLYTLNGVNVNTHFHPGVQSGPSNTGPMI